MSDPNEGSSSLDLDRADFSSHEGGPAAPACAACSSALSETYYTLGQQMLCEPCYFTVRDAGPPGSVVSRAFGALGLGLVAAIVAGLLWLVVTEVTGYQLGLIAIVVGLLVGKAVQIGGRGVGGAGYQVLAVVLTYSAIVMTYVPAIVAEIRASDDFALSVEAEAAGAGDYEPTYGEEEEEPPPLDEASITLILYGIAIPLAYTVPFLGGFENIIGILIIGFALYEAWKINKRVQMELKGPFRLGEVAPSVG